MWTKQDAAAAEALSEAERTRGWLDCRCCSRPVPPMDAYPIHTRCIVKHWARHAHYVNASRCREFGGEREPFKRG